MGAVKVGGAPNHVTVTLRRIKLHDSLKVSIWDTWGLDSKNYKGETIKVMMEGRIPNDWKMYESVAGSPEKLLPDGSAGKQLRQVHAVLFLVPYASLEDEAELVILKQKFAQIAEEINPILLLARIDELVPTVRTAPEKMLTEAKIISLTAKAAKAFRIPDHRVLPCVPYIKETHRDFELDRLLFRVLSTALEAGNDWIKYQEKDDAVVDDAPYSPEPAPEEEEREKFSRMKIYEGKENSPGSNSEKSPGKPKKKDEPQGKKQEDDEDKAKAKEQKKLIDVLSRSGGFARKLAEKYVKLLDERCETWKLEEVRNETSIQDMVNGGIPKADAERIKDLLA